MSILLLLKIQFTHLVSIGILVSLSAYNRAFVQKYHMFLSSHLAHSILNGFQSFIQHFFCIICKSSRSFPSFINLRLSHTNTKCAITFSHEKLFKKIAFERVDNSLSFHVITYQFISDLVAKWRFLYVITKEKIFLVVTATNLREHNSQTERNIEQLFF